MNLVLKTDKELPRLNDTPGRGNRMLKEQNGVERVQTVVASGRYSLGLMKPSGRGNAMIRTHRAEFVVMLTFREMTTLKKTEKEHSTGMWGTRGE